MLRRFTIAIAHDAAERLTALARAQRRDPRARAALILERVPSRPVRGDARTFDEDPGHIDGSGVPTGRGPGQ